MSQSRFFGVIITPDGPPLRMDECAITHASLADPDKGSCSVFVGSQMLVRLDVHMPQTQVCLPLGSSAKELRVEGPKGSPGVHLLGRTRADHPLPASNIKVATAPSAAADGPKKKAKTSEMAAASENLLSEMVSPPSAVNPSAAHTLGPPASMARRRRRRCASRRPSTRRPITRTCRGRRG